MMQGLGGARANGPGSWMQSRMLDPREGLDSGQPGRSCLGTGGREGRCSQAGIRRLWAQVLPPHPPPGLPLPGASLQPPSPPHVLWLNPSGLSLGVASGLS